MGILGIIDILGIVVFLFTHLLFLSQATGLHFDEAWAANFAAGLAQGSALRWDLQAMSPYTSAWGHLWAAFLFKLFGTSLWTYRLSGVLLCTAGVWGMSRALVLLGWRRAGALLPWILAAFVPALINHRFCIDLTTVHVFCFGLLCYGLACGISKKDRLGLILVGISIGIGVTSHILFIAPVLALLCTILLTQEEIYPRQRKLILCMSLLFIPWLLHIAFSIPEKDKAIALLVLDHLILIWAGLFKCKTVKCETIKCKTGLKKKWKAWGLSILFLLSLPSLAFFIFFSEGDWSILFTQGWIANPIPSIMAIFSTALIVMYLFRNRFQFQVQFQAQAQAALQFQLNQWFLLTLFFLSVIILKPAPRYYEIGFLMAAALFAIELEKSSPFYRKTLLSLFFIASFSQLIPNYYSTGINGLGQNRIFGGRLLKDRSTDSLSQFALVRELGKRGCGLKNLETHNPRLKESLEFLSHGDWEVASDPTCPGPIRAEVYEDIPKSQNPSWEKIGEFGLQHGIVPSDNTL